VPSVVSKVLWRERLPDVENVKESSLTRAFTQFFRAFFSRFFVYTQIKFSRHEAEMSNDLQEKNKLSPISGSEKIDMHTA
jgi:hypothetical protein